MTNKKRSYTDKHNTSFIQIGSGQRFSVLLHTQSKPNKQQYFLQLETRERDNLTRSYAVINYGPPFNSSNLLFYPPTSPPLTLPPTDISFLDYQLRPHYSPTYSSRDLPTAAEVTRRVNITVHLSEPDGALIYLEDGYTWNEGLLKEPYLVSLYKNDSVEWPCMARALNNSGLDPITRAFPAEIGEVLEIVIQNTGSDGGEMETHPWHAHGAHYWDLGSGEGVYDAVANEAKWANSTGKPVKREYVPIPASLLFSLSFFTFRMGFEREAQGGLIKNTNADFVIVRQCSIEMCVTREMANLRGGELGD